MTQKQRSLAALGGLVLVAAALGGLAWQTSRSEAAKKQADEQQSKLFDFTKEQVTGLKVTAKGQTTELTKQGDAWSLVAPMKAPADSSAIDTLLSRLMSMKKTATVDEHPADLKKFGLGTPSVQIVAFLEGGKTAELSLGDENPFNRARYVKKGGSEAVYLSDGSSGDALDKTPFDLRDKRLLPFEDKDVSRIDIEGNEAGNGQGYSLARDGNTWQMVSPTVERADEAVVNRVLGALRNLRATAIPEEDARDLAKYGLDPPKLKVTLTLAGNAKASVLFGQVDDKGEKKAYVKRGESAMVAQVALNAADDLKQTPESLEDKTVAAFDREQVGSLHFTLADGTRIQVQRKKDAKPDGGFAEETWTELSPKSAPAKKWKMSGLVYNLSSLKGTKIAAASPSAAELAKLGLDKPKASVTVEDKAGKVLAELLVGDEDGSNVYVKSAAGPRVYEVEKLKLADLPKGPDDLLDQPPPATSNMAKNVAQP